MSASVPRPMNKRDLPRLLKPTGILLRPYSAKTSSHRKLTLRPFGKAALWLLAFSAPAASALYSKRQTEEAHRQTAAAQRMNALTAEMLNAAKSQATSAEVQAGASVQSVDIAQLSTEIARKSAIFTEAFTRTAERAYVYVGQVGSSDFQPGRSLVLGVVIENMGRTPATDCLYKAIAYDGQSEPQDTPIPLSE